MPRALQWIRYQRCPKLAREVCNIESRLRLWHPMQAGRTSRLLPLDAATGGERSDRAETFSAPGTVIIAKESRQVPLPPEPFVSADEAAQFLCVKRRYLLELARRGIAGAYALGTGGKRKIWVFRLSELAASVVRNETSIPKPLKPCTIGPGSPR